MPRDYSFGDGKDYYKIKGKFKEGDKVTVVSDSDLDRVEGNDNIVGLKGDILEGPYPSYGDDDMVKNGDNYYVVDLGGFEYTVSEKDLAPTTVTKTSSKPVIPQKLDRSFDPRVNKKFLQERIKQIVKEELTKEEWDGSGGGPRDFSKFGETEHTVHDNAIRVKSGGHVIGEVYPCKKGEIGPWGFLHYNKDFGREGYDTKEQAAAALKTFLRDEFKNR